MKRRSALLAAPFLLAVPLLLAATPVSTSRPTPASAALPRKLPPRAGLPTLARSLLAQRMETHGDQMTELVWTVLFLEHQGTRDIADAIAGEPRIARPNAQTDPDELSARLPAKFFDLQDTLHDRALALAAAAKSGKDDEIAKAYGRLSETCVACHATYLEEK
jgi:hypothetical protein